MEICNGGIYHRKETIFERELVLNHGTSAHIFLTKGEQKKAKQVIRTRILEEGWELRASLQEEAERKKQDQHDIYNKVRREVPEKSKQNGDRTSLSSIPFDIFLDLYLDPFGRSIIQSYIKVRNNEFLQDDWSSNKECYPFITAFIKGFVYSLYYAEIEQNKKLDKNAQSDYELMMYLTHADILVSADTKFLRHAFVELWEPRGKKLLTPEEFVTFIDTL